MQLTELFERVTQEHFTDTPGVPLTSRIRAMGKVMGNLMHSGMGQPPLAAGKKRSLTCWNRAVRNPVDIDQWRKQTEEKEKFSTRPMRMRMQMAEADRGLTPWIRTHEYLTPAPLDRG